MKDSSTPSPPAATASGDSTTSLSHAAQGQLGIASRRALLVTAGVAAASAGVWFGQRALVDQESASSHDQAASHAGHEPSPSVASASATPGADAPLVRNDDVTDAFWQQSFDTPDGRSLNLSSMKGQPLLINFWATWCPPCVKEMPEIDRFNREVTPLGWRVLGLAIDGPTPVKTFLTKVRVGFALGLAGFGGTELAQALGNTAGGLPFTVLIDSQGRIRQRKMGATSHAELKAWLHTLKAG